MLDAPYRVLKSRRDFERVFARGESIKTTYFVAYYLPGNTGDFRIGICVGKSLGKAVKRNRLKRQIREAIKKIDPRSDNLDLVIIARKKIVGANFWQIVSALGRLFSKIEIL